MYISCIVFLPLVALSMACPYQVPCNCGLGSGENPCTDTKCQPLVVRPVEIPKPLLPPPTRVVCKTVPGVPPLLPIPGPCSCQSAIVKPAIVPKPACKACKSCQMHASSQMQSSYLNQRQDLLMGGYGGAPAPLPTYYDEMMPSPANPAAYMPADAVSIAIAQKLAQEACLHAEDKLSFGFRKLPKEMPQILTKKLNNIREENLYAMNGAIVELKPVACASSKSLAEEAAEELLEMAAEEEEALEITAPFKKISLGEIGYGPAKLKPAPFLDVPLSPLALLADKAVEEQAPVICNDGFKPGNVIFKHAPKPESLALPPPLPEPCSSEEEYLMPPMPVLPPPPPPQMTPFYVQQSSSSASNYANKMSNVFIQKLGGCGL